MKRLKKDITNSPKMKMEAVERMIADYQYIINEYI